MPASAPPARLASAALALAMGLAASVAGAQAAPAPPPPEPVVTMGAAPPSPGLVTLPPKADPVTFEIGARLGGAVRIGDAPAFSITGRTGFVAGVGVAVAPSPRFSVGLGYEHVDMGGEHGEGDLGVVDLDRSLDSLWASVRLTVFRFDCFALGVALGPGLVWQNVTASAIVYGGTAGRPDLFQCSETGGPGLGLRVGLRVEGELGNGFFLTADGTLDELRLSSDPLGTCAPGAGSTAVFAARAGMAYRFDVSRYVR